jgi:hypothetical protein
VRAAVVLGTNLAVAVAALAWLLSRYGEEALALLARSPSPPLLAAFGVPWSWASPPWRCAGALLAGLGCEFDAGTMSAPRRGLQRVGARTQREARR